MATLAALVRELTGDRSSTDDGFSDRLSHRYTTTILIVFAVAVSTKQYVGAPINCWAPVHFTDNHVDYTNDYCWVRNTYYLPYEEEVPKEGEAWKRDTIVYYQWMPLILLAQAFLFYAPCLVWRGMGGRSGLDVTSVTQMARTIATFQMKGDIRDRLYAQMVMQMNRYLVNCKNETKTSFTISLKHIFSRTCCRLCGRQRGNYLLSLYLFVKVLYLLNALGQLFVLNALLETDYHLFGIEALKSLSEGKDWGLSKLFPRVTMCDLKVRRLGNVHRYTVQCVLPVNLFNEKIYLFLWFWIVIVIAITFISLLKWSLRAIIKIDRHRYIKKHLKLSGVKPDDDDTKRAMVTFVEDYLNQDGVFLIHLVDQTTNTLTALELTHSLWTSQQHRPPPVAEPRVPAKQ